MGVNGQKVWAGNEKCSPVTWQDCKLDRKEPYPTCQGDNNVDIKVSVTKCQFVTGTRCEPETGVNAWRCLTRSVTRREWTTVIPARSGNQDRTSFTRRNVFSLLIWRNLQLLTNIKKKN